MDSSRPISLPQSAAIVILRYVRMPRHTKEMMIVRGYILPNQLVLQNAQLVEGIVNLNTILTGRLRKCHAKSAQVLLGLGESKTGRVKLGSGAEISRISVLSFSDSIEFLTVSKSIFWVLINLRRSLVTIKYPGKIAMSRKFSNQTT